MTVLSGQYDPALVGLSVVIAILAAGAALDLAGRVTATHGRARALWHAGGALAMGLGIWSMHYTGMLAFQLPVPVIYHVPTVVLSLVAAILASGVALFVASRSSLGAVRIAVGSAVMGSGIAAMHYTGMAAMRLPATMTWNALLVAASIAIAIAVSGVALVLAFRFGHAIVASWTRLKVASAVIMGAAIPSMHYTGMAAARFSPGPGHLDPTLAVSVSSLGLSAIVAGTFTVLVLAIVTSVVDQRIVAERQRAAEKQAGLLRELQASLAEIKVLHGILPICASCKRIREADGKWAPVESYVREHSNAEFTHGLCPDCAKQTWG
jgi:two-component system, sensor histidine kinase and response regulator